MAAEAPTKKKGYYYSPGELHYRELVAQKREHLKRSKVENAFYRTYGKWPNEVELSQAERFLTQRSQPENDS